MNSMATDEDINQTSTTLKKVSETLYYTTHMIADNIWVFLRIYNNALDYRNKELRQSNPVYDEIKKIRSHTQRKSNWIILWHLF